MRLPTSFVLRARAIKNQFMTFFRYFLDRRRRGSLAKAHFHTLNGLIHVVNQLNHNRERDWKDFNRSNRTKTQPEIEEN